MIEGQDLTTSLENALLGGCGESEGSYQKFGKLDEANIVCDSSDNNNDFAVTFGSGLGLFYNSGEGDGGTVNLGEEKAVEDDLKKSALSSCTWEKYSQIARPC